MKALGIILAGGNNYRMRELSEKPEPLRNAGRRWIPCH